jgi:hypothetical protein
MTELIKQRDRRRIKQCNPFTIFKNNLALGTTVEVNKQILEAAKFMMTTTWQWQMTTQPELVHQSTNHKKNNVAVSTADAEAY